MAVSLVLDSWVLMAWLKGQDPGAGFMRELWERAYRREAKLAINIVNLGEVFYLTAKARDIAAAERVLVNLRARPLDILSVTDSLVLEAARLKARYPISYADAFAVATAAMRRRPLVTGDPEVRRLEADRLVTLEWAGSPP